MASMSPEELVKQQRESLHTLKSQLGTVQQALAQQPVRVGCQLCS